MGLTLKESAEALIKTHEASSSLLMRSMPGIGKSSIEEATCAALSLMYDEPFGNVIFMLSLIDPVDFGGFMYPADNPDGSIIKVSAFSLPPVIPNQHNFSVLGGAFKVYWKGKEIVHDGEGGYMYKSSEVPVDDLPDWFLKTGVPRKGAVFLDEWGQAGPEIQKPAADLWLNRRVRGIQLPKGWTVWGATNREEDQSGVNREYAFNINRRGEFDVDYSNKVWLEWAMQRRIHPHCRGYVEWQEGKCFATEVPSNPQPFCTPRSLVNAFATWNALSSPEDRKEQHLPQTQTAYELLKGFVGKAQADELFAYMSTAKDLWKPSEIFADPKGAPIYENRPDALFIVTNAITQAVTNETADSCFDYMMRLPRDWQVHVIRNCLNVCPAVMSQGPKFVKFANENKNLMRAAQA